MMYAAVIVFGFSFAPHEHYDVQAVETEAIVVPYT